VGAPRLVRGLEHLPCGERMISPWALGGALVTDKESAEEMELSSLLRMMGGQNPMGAS